MTETPATPTVETVPLAILRGTAMTTCVWLIYGHLSGLAGDVFFSFADAYGIPAMLLTVAALTAFAMYGALHVARLVIAILTILYVQAYLAVHRRRRSRRTIKS